IPHDPVETMIAIKLSRGQQSLIDDQDLGIVAPYKWYALHEPKNDSWYAYTRIRVGGKKTSLSMHRLIMNAQKGEIIDHRDRNGLNNQRDNLRRCSHAENMRNRKKQRNGTLPYKGIRKNTNSNSFSAAIKAGGKILHIGSYQTQLEAALA